MESINKKFKQLRNHHRLTQVEFAGLLKMTQANVSQIENGDCIPSGETLIKLYKVYPTLDFNWLIKGLSGWPFIQGEGDNPVKECIQENLIL